MIDDGDAGWRGFPRGNSSPLLPLREAISQPYSGTNISTEIRHNGNPTL